MFRNTIYMTNAISIISIIIIGGSVNHMGMFQNTIYMKNEILMEQTEISENIHLSMKFGTLIDVYLGGRQLLKIPFHIFFHY